MSHGRPYLLRHTHHTHHNTTLHCTGAQMRAVGSTKMNEISSRSHAVFIIIAEQSETVYVDERGREMTAEDFSKLMHQHGLGMYKCVRTCVCV